MKRLTFTILFVLAGALSCVQAQYDVHFTHFREMENFYNPAAMNRDSKLNAIASYSMQMAGYTNAPGSLYAGANSVLPFGMGHHSASASLFNESIGLFSSQRLTIDYAYKIGIGKAWLNLGIQAGVMSQQFDGSEVRAKDGGDPAFPNGKDKGTAADLAAGLFFMYGELYLGASCQHLNAPHVEFGKPDAAQTYMDIARMYYIHGGYNIRTNNPLFSIQPCFMLASDLESFRTDFQTRAVYSYEKFDLYCGLTWSPDISWTVLLGGTYGNMTVGYAYELFTRGVGYLNGSHDLILNWKKEVDFFKKGRNSHKSVRYL